MVQFTCEILWVHHLLIEDCVTNKTLYDNQVVLHITSNPVYHERIKHIEVDCHLICEKIQENVISTSYVKSGEQLDDIFTEVYMETGQNILVTSWHD